MKKKKNHLSEGIYKCILIIIIALCIAVRFILNPDTSEPIWLIVVFEIICLILVIRYILEIFRGK